jgi:hypothetical protein
VPYYANSVRISAVIKDFPGSHVTAALGNVEQNYDYCTKSQDFVEQGVKPMSQKRKGEVEKVRWAEVFKAAEEGRDQDIPEEIRFKFDRNIERIRDKAIQRRKLEDTETQHEWYYGSTHPYSGNASASTHYW